MKMFGFLTLPWILVIFCVINGILAEVPRFKGAELVNHMENDRVSDASGLAASRKHRGVLYTHNDSQKRDHNVYAINASTAGIISTLRLFPAENHDWEDIAVGPCGHTTCIYVGDQMHGTIYRVEEPDFIYSDQILPGVSAFHYHWPYKFDTLMVDRHSNMYIISSHHDDDRKIGRITHDMWGSHKTVEIPTDHNLPHLSNLQRHEPSGGDISPDGSQILISTHEHVYYWKVQHDDVLATMQHTPIKLPTQTSGTVEGICWDTEGHNYYEIEEKHHPGTPPLYIFNRV